MIKLLLSLLLIANAIVDCEENLLLNKPLHFNSKPGAWLANANDGSGATCCWMYHRKMHFLVYDLKAIYKIEKVRILIGWYVPKPKYPYRIYVSDKYEPCIHSTMSTGMQLCKEYGMDLNKQTVACKNGGIKGRFIIVIKGNETTTSATNEDFNICSFEAYGEKISNTTVPKPFKMIESTDSGPSADDFDITKQILGPTGKQTVTVPYYGGTVTNYDSNCQPIIWINSKKAAFSQACQTANGKGRIVLFSKYAFFKELMKEKSEFKTNLLKWLSPRNPNPKIYESLSFLSVADIKSKIKIGDIVLYDCYKTHKKEIHNELKSLLVKGEIAMSFDRNVWQSSTKESKQYRQEIYDIFYVNFVYSFVTWSSEVPVVLDIKDLSGEYKGLLSKVRQLIKSYSYLMNHGDSIVDKLEKAPIHLLTNSSIKDDFIKMIKYYLPYVKENCPCPAKPLSDDNAKKFLRIYTRLASLAFMQNSGIKSPCVKSFPGDFNNDKAGKTVTLEITGVTSSTKNPIGYYLRAGQTLKYRILKSTGTWWMYIGCHTDLLKLSQNNWLRLPNVHAGYFELVGSVGYSYTPYGGNLWLYNSKPGDILKIELSNVIETPFLNVRDNTSLQNWEKNRNAPGLWAQLAGDSMVLCVESKLIRTLSVDLAKTLLHDNWDKMVRQDFILRHDDWKIKRPEIFVFDIMPNAGYGHSGYPIVVYDDWFNDMFTLKEVKEGNWGVCHEVGHNMQKGVWTFGSSDITNNVFCMYNYDKLWHKKLHGTIANNKAQREKKETIQNYLKNPDYQKWTGQHFLALMIYGQLAEHLGWGFYRETFHYYNTHKLSPSSEQDEIDTWIITTSKVVKQNLSPIFEYWGFKISNKVKSVTGSLKCFMPDDDFTKLNPERIASLIDKYKPCHRVSTYKVDINEKKMIEGTRKNFIKKTG